MQIKFPSRFAAGRPIEADVSGAPNQAIATRHVLEHYAQSGQELHSVIIDAEGCDGAHLAGIRLINCLVRGSFKEANFTGAVIDCGSLSGMFDLATFKGAQVINVTVDGSFSNLRAQESEWSFCNLHKMLADKANFGGGSFSNCKTSGMQAPGASFAMTMFRATFHTELLRDSCDPEDVQDATKYLANYQNRSAAKAHLDALRKQAAAA